MKTTFRILVCIALCLLLPACGAAKAPKQTEITVLAAASLKDALTQICADYEAEHDVTITVSYGASGALQQQIMQGAPADIFISAGQAQMDALSKAQLLTKAGATPLLQNRLALIVPKNAVALTDFTALSALSKIAVGDAASVPAGKYAAEALKTLGLADTLAPKLVFAKDVREVLAWVETGNADAGIVYETDALISKDVQLCCTFPQDSHAPIVYPMAVLQNAKEAKAAEAFCAYLQKTDAAKVFIQYGFTPAA